jgi:hypothetical protein
MTANAGYHLFNTGDVLTAAQVQYNLQNQTIMYFASSAARTAALSGVVVEGMFSYLADTNSTEYYDGAAWQSISNPGDITAVTAGTGISGGGTSGAVTVTNSMATAITTNGDVIYGTGSGTFSRLGIGSSAQVLTVASGVPSWATPATSTQKVIQVVSASYSTSTSSSSASYIDTGLTATITPTLNTSKILVLLAQNGAYKPDGSTTGAIGLKLLRAGSDIAQITTNGLYTDTNMMLYGSSYALTYLDAPATTSATIYKTQFQRTSGLGNATVQITSSVSTITLLEIGA